jgi:hypothetical protein
MKKLNYYMSLILVVLLMTNCKKENIVPDNNDKIFVIDSTWKPYVATWTLIMVANSKGVQQNFIPHTFTLNSDVTTNGCYGNSPINSIYKVFWNINNNILKFYSSDKVLINNIIPDKVFTIISLDSNTNILILIDNIPCSDGNTNQTWTYKKQ